MSGLLIKDFNLMKTQKRFFSIVVAIAIIMALSMNDNFFILGYITFIIPLFALSTISYDEVDNGNAFLFTLPISRKEYVYEKYCFSLLLGVASLVLAVSLSVVFGLLKKVPILETLTASPFIFGIMVVIIAVMIPIQLRFGADNGRIVLVAVFGITAVFGFGIVQLLKLFDVDIPTLLEKLMKLNFGALVVITTVIVTVLLLLSIRISVAVINKKGF